MIIDKNYKMEKLIKEKVLVENHIKELNKNDLFLLIKILEKYYYMNNNSKLYFNYLISNIINFKLFDYSINTFKKKYINKNE